MPSRLVGFPENSGDVLSVERVVEETLILVHDYGEFVARFFIANICYGFEHAICVTMHGDFLVRCQCLEIGVCPQFRA